KGAGNFQVAANPDTAQLAAFFRGLPAVTESVVVSGFKRPLEDRRKLTAVVSVPESRRVRNFLGLDQVAAAQLGGIDAGGVCGRVDDALDQIARLRPSSAAIRPRWQSVGEHAACIHLRDRNVIDRRQATGDVGREYKMCDPSKICSKI